MQGIYKTNFCVSILTSVIDQSRQLACTHISMWCAFAVQNLVCSVQVRSLPTLKEMRQGGTFETRAAHNKSHHRCGSRPGNPRPALTLSVAVKSTALLYEVWELSWSTTTTTTMTTAKGSPVAFSTNDEPYGRDGRSRSRDRKSPADGTSRTNDNHELALLIVFKPRTRTTLHVDESHYAKYERVVNDWRWLTVYWYMRWPF